MFALLSFLMQGSDNPKPARFALLQPSKWFRVLTPCGKQALSCCSLTTEKNGKPLRPTYQMTHPLPHLHHINQTAKKYAQPMPMQKKDHQKLVHHNHKDQSTTKACSCFLVSICFHQFQLGSNMPKLTALPSCNTLVDITKVYHSIVISRPEGQTQASQSSDLGLSIRNGCLLLAS